MHPSIEKLLDVQKLDRETRLLDEAKIRRPMELNDDKRKGCLRQGGGWWR